MMVLIFSVGVLVFFLTVYGTVVAGGLQLTREQLKTSPELAPGLDVGSADAENSLPTRDVIAAEF
jgi:hypothetical protein